MKTLEELVIKKIDSKSFLLKKNWMVFLTFGIILIFNNCHSTSWIQRYEFVYINQTDFTIKFIPTSYHSNNVVILPKSSNIVEVLECCEETINKEYAQSVLNFFLRDGGNNSVIVFIDETSCVEFFDSGFVEILNYQYKMLGKRHVRYTYTFTEADFSNQKTCNQIN